MQTKQAPTQNPGAHRRTLGSNAEPWGPAQNPGAQCRTLGPWRVLHSCGIRTLTAPAAGSFVLLQSCSSWAESEIQIPAHLFLSLKDLKTSVTFASAGLTDVLHSGCTENSLHNRASDKTVSTWNSTERSVICLLQLTEELHGHLDAALLRAQGCWAPQSRGRDRPPHGPGITEVLVWAEMLYYPAELGGDRKFNRFSEQKEMNLIKAAKNFQAVVSWCQKKVHKKLRWEWKSSTSDQRWQLLSGESVDFLFLFLRWCDKCAGIRKTDQRCVYRL